MEKKFSVPRGTSDILPSEVTRWQEVEQKARHLLHLYGYKEIRTPIFEETSLFARSLGQTSDVVQKQMLNLLNQRQDSNTGSTETGLSLRPEATASIVRSYVENSFDRRESLSKLYYIGPMFRGERPQKGRLRQFHQIGVEAIGPESTVPYLDAEVIALSSHLLKELGLDGFKLKINSLGTIDDKRNLSTILRGALKKELAHLCEDCQVRFERNVFRVLDCKNRECKKIVQKLALGDSHLCAESKKYFTRVKEALDLMKIHYVVDPHLVRGLDYYTHTVFEISHDALGSQDALGAGGRYNNLVSELGGDNKGVIGAVGFALGVERILLAQGQSETAETKIDAFIVSLDIEGETKAYEKAFLILNELRQNDLAAEMNYAPGSMKSQMRAADKSGAGQVIILGENELKENMVTLKDMKTGDQEKIAQNKIVQVLRNKLGKK